MMRMRNILIGVVLALMIAGSAAAAAPTVAIPYQGHLTDANGLDLTTDMPIEVRLYDSAIAGIEQPVTNAHVLYAERHAAVHVEKGIFRLEIGVGQQLDPKWTGLPVETLASKENVYLELWIDGERLSPRQRMGAMPAAYRAKYARYADAITNLPAITANDIHNYSAEIITSGVINEAHIPSNLNVSLISGTLDQKFVPATLSVDQFDQTSPLPASLIQKMDAGKIVGGSLNKEMLDSSRYVAKNDVAILSGSASDGQTLNFPNGFSDSQCVYMLTPGITLGSVEGIDQIMLSVDANGLVTCKFDEKNQVDGGSDHKIVSCTANYMAICRKGYCKQGDRLVAGSCTP